MRPDFCGKLSLGCQHSRAAVMKLTLDRIGLCRKMGTRFGSSGFGSKLSNCDPGFFAL